MVIYFILIFFLLFVINKSLGKEGFQLNLNPKGNINPFLTLPEKMITWKPYPLEGTANASAYFYQNPYMHPVY